MGSREKLLAILAILCVSVLVCGCLGGEQSSSEPTDTTSKSESHAASDSNAPEEGSPSSDRYVEINLLDGTKVGGKYVSETAAFTTILVMYTIDPNAYTYYNSPGRIEQGSYSKGPLIKVKDPDNYLVKGTGAEVSIKNSLINTMVTIEDPTPMIEATLQEMNANAVAMKKASEDIAEGYRIVKEEREAKQRR